jgi:[ribosomal protein S5]-alanine N-acetyltransferase
VLHTERLDLIPLSPVHLQLYLEQASQLEQELGISISQAVLTERAQRAIRMKIAKMANAEQIQTPWYTYWLIIIRVLPFGAGLAGFKGFPDQNGEAEIGYGIDPNFQGKGYTTEAVKCLISWAFQEAACLAVVARNTKKWNLASLRVLTKAGMKVYEETDDALWLRVDRENWTNSNQQGK